MPERALQEKTDQDSILKEFISSEKCSVIMKFNCGLVPPLNKYLLSFYYVPGILSGFEDKTINQTIIHESTGRKIMNGSEK